MAGEARATVSWLHLSDLHFRVSVRWSQDVVLASLIEDVRARYSGTLRPELLFISGDIAFSGQAEEYALAEQFVRDLLGASSISPNRLFLVPGNHDVDREIEEDAWWGVRARLKDQSEVDRFFASDGRRRTLLRRLEAFRAFANRIAPPDGDGYTPGSFAHAKCVTVGPISVNVLLLDSAWLAGGGPGDIGGLLVGEPQVIEAHRLCRAPGLTFALLHHPLSRLCEFEQVPVENLLLERVNLMLQGHVHSDDVRWLGVGNQRLTVFTAGAGFETRTSENCYLWCSVDLRTGLGRAIVHRYVHARKGWEACEPHTWHLVNLAKSGVPLQRAMGILRSRGADLLHYKAALLAGLVVEGPRTMAGDRVWMSLEADLPGDANVAGAILTQLRHMIHWEAAWRSDEWEAEVSRLIDGLGSDLKAHGQATPDIAARLKDSDEICRRMTQGLAGAAGSSGSPVLEQIRQLSATGEWTTVLEVLARWESAGVSSAGEALEMRRVGARALLELGRPAEAIEKLAPLLSEQRPSAEDLYLAAACHYRAKNFQAAAAHMHRAIDSGLDLNQAEGLALAIAGHAGDPSLVKRVRPE